jgi:acetyltransferase-like isoleucine patch superfamily enzyme
MSVTLLPAFLPRRVHRGWMFKTLFFCLIEDCIRNISGPLGLRLRRFWYGRRFKSCGRNLVIEPGVMISSPNFFICGDNVWIDRNVTLIAGPPRGGLRVDVRGQPSDLAPGYISIGNDAHLGISTIVQGHGAVQIGDAFTASAGVKIYSLSNDPRSCRSGTVSNDASYILYPVRIGRNVWLGLNSIVIGHHIEDDCFVKAGAVVTTDIPSNSVVDGSPARVVGSRFVDRVGEENALA